METSVNKNKKHIWGSSLGSVPRIEKRRGIRLILVNHLKFWGSFSGKAQSINNMKEGNGQQFEI